MWRSPTMLFLYFLVAGLGPSLWAGLYLEKYTGWVKLLEESGASWWKSFMRRIFPALVLPLAWAMWSACVLFDPTPAEILPLFMLTWAGSLIVMFVGLALIILTNKFTGWLQIAEELGDKGYS